MNNTQFKTLKNKLNLSYQTLSHLVGESSIATIEKWDSDQNIPAHVIKFISKIDSIFEFTLQGCIQQIAKLNEEFNINFIAYKNDDDFKFADPILFKLLLSNEIHIALLRKIFEEARKLNIRLGIIDFDKKNYLIWLNEKGYCPCDHHRSEWANKIKYTITLGQKELMEEMLNTATENVLEMKKMLSLRKPFTQETFMINKIEAFQNALLYGILEFGEGAISAFNDKKLILSATAARALFERQAIIYYLYKLVEEIIKNDDAEKLKANLQKIMFGARGNFKIVESINILTIINKEIKEIFPDSKTDTLYEALCDLVHPNFNGVFDAYITLDTDNLAFIIEPHDKGNIGLTVLTGLSTGTSLTLMYYEKLKDLIQNQGNVLIEKYKNCISDIKD